jgi:hypothetical protein
VRINPPKLPGLWGIYPRWKILQTNASRNAPLLPRPLPNVVNLFFGQSREEQVRVGSGPSQPLCFTDGQPRKAKEWLRFVAQFRQQTQLVPVDLCDNGLLKARG